LILTLTNAEPEDLAAEKEIKQIPKELEAIAKDYNTLLDEAIELLESIEFIRRKLKATQDSFYSLQNLRSSCLERMNRMAPLKLEEGLGRLGTGQERFFKN
jgi:chromosome segregation ATPase